MNKESVYKLFESKDRKKAFFEVLKETSKKINNHSIEEEDIQAYLLAKALTDNRTFSDIQKFTSNFVTLRVYIHTNYYWRGRPYALLASTYLAKKNRISKKEKAEFYREIASFFRMVSDYKTALSNYELAFANSHKGYDLYDIVVMHQYLNDGFTLDLPSEELEKKYPNESGRIIAALDGKGFLKIDPIENS